jgi:hypothetical protein
MPRTAIVVLLCVIAAPTYAQVFMPDRVSVKVGGDESLKGDVTSYIKRELRSLNDLVITDDNPRFSISVLIVRVRGVRGEDLGFSMSVVVTELSGRSLANIIKPESCGACVASSWGRALGETLPDMVEVQDHLLFTGGPDDLQTLCRNVVTGIDTDIFEPRRAIIQKSKDRTKKP